MFSLRWFLPGILLAVCAVTPGPGIPAPARLVAADLRSEYLRNPLGIDERFPRLSWTLQAPGRGQKQTAYQVLVASGDAALREGRGDLWDRGKAVSDRTNPIVYQGLPLRSGQRCVWKVRSWDASDRPGPFSAPAFWEMGLLEPGDWSSMWIGLPGECESASLEGARWVWFPEGNPQASVPVGTRYFRRRLELPRKPTRARFYVAVDNEFVLFANGREVARGGGWESAHVVDLVEHLRPGENVLAVAATNQGGPAGLLGRLYLEADAKTRIDIDARWKSADREQAGWQNPGFDDGAWVAAREFAPVGVPPWNVVSVSRAGQPCPFLRREFQLAKPVRRARAYVTALGVYQLYLNGARVGDQILAPGWTDYRKRVQYQTYDVGDLVREGQNAVGAILGDGWYAGSLGWNLQRNQFGPDPPRLRLQLRIELADGSVETIESDERWLGARGPIRESDIYGGETYDARLDFPGWASPGFLRQLRAGTPPATLNTEPRMQAGRLRSQATSTPNTEHSTLNTQHSSSWHPVTVFTDRSPELNAQMDPPIRIVEEFAPRQITEPKPGVYVVDFGQNLVGWARLKAQGEPGSEITLRFAEVLNPDGTVHRANLRRARATDTFILKGDSREVLEPHFTYHGFRYVEVTGYPGRPGTDALVGVAFNSALARSGRFTSSSDLLNRLFQNILWAQRGNLMSVPTDCPQRDERLGWMGDAQLFARTACFNMDMAAFFTKWMRDIVDAQSPEGFFSDVSPRVIDLADGAPAWADAGIVVPWTVYLCYGDTRILERNFDAMAKYVDLLVRSNPDLLWLRRRNNDFGDWVAAGGQTSKELIGSAYLAYDLRLLSEMAAAIGRTSDVQRYARLADRSTAAFLRRFFTADGKATSDTQTAYAMSLGMGLIPASARTAAGARLAEAVRRANDHLSTGFIGTAFLLPALTDTGQDALAYRLLLNRDYPSWLYMVEKGATTIWELWNSDTAGPGMNSRNHFAFGSVGEWLQRTMAGIEIDPAAPGYRRVILRPHPGGGIRFAETEYSAITGRVTTAWTVGQGGVDLRVTLPANVSATVFVPKNGAASPRITEGGRAVWQSGRFVAGVDGLTAGRDAGDHVAFEVGSGSYAFRLTGAPSGEGSARRR